MPWADGSARTATAFRIASKTAGNTRVVGLHHEPYPHWWTGDRPRIPNRHRRRCRRASRPRTCLTTTNMSHAQKAARSRPKNVRRPPSCRSSRFPQYPRALPLAFDTVRKSDAHAENRARRNLDPIDRARLVKLRLRGPTSVSESLLWRRARTLSCIRGGSSSSEEILAQCSRARPMAGSAACSPGPRPCLF